MSKLRVLNIITDTNIGGAGKIVLTYCQHYDKGKIDLILAVPTGSQLKPICDEQGIVCVTADGIADESLSLRGIAALYKLIRSIRPSIVHTHASLSARIAGKLAGAKVVYTRHSVFEPTGFMKSFVGKTINKITAALFSDKIIAVAQAAKDNLTDVGIADKKIQVILNGIQPLEPLGDEQIAQARKRFGVQEGQKVISIVARIEEVKGHACFIETAKILKQRGLNVKCIAAGTGSLYEQYKDNQDVDFCGFITDVDKLISISDVTANASFGTEATSIALLEGMSLGIPAVVTDYGGNPGVIQNGENGFLVGIKDPTAMADRMQQILTDPALYQTLSRGAKEIFAKTFTAEAMSRQIEQVYDSLENQKEGK